METALRSSAWVKSSPKQIGIPFAAGFLAALVMLGIYRGILSAFQSVGHALQQAAQDWGWIGLVTLGFGIQIGLYTYLRTIIHSIKLTGTSTLGMIACCLHHLSDIAPLVALTGASSLSGVISFFDDWKYAIIALGIAMNALGIVVIVQIIQKSKIHLETMAVSAVENVSTGH